MFFHAFHQLHVITSSLAWFTGLPVSLVIDQSDNIGFTNNYMKDHIFELTYRELDQSCLHIFLHSSIYYHLSYIHLHSSPSKGILRTHKVTSSQLARCTTLVS